MWFIWQRLKTAVRCCTYPWILNVACYAGVVGSFAPKEVIAIALLQDVIFFRKSQNSGVDSSNKDLNGTCGAEKFWSSIFPLEQPRPWDWSLNFSASKQLQSLFSSPTIAISREESLLLLSLLLQGLLFLNSSRHLSTHCVSVWS